MNSLHLLKLGGRALETDEQVRELAAEIRRVPGRFVLVHGGGSEVSSWSRRLGIEPRFVNGLRVTDAGTLEVAVAVLAGLANKRLTAVLADAGLKAVGVSALDGGMVSVAPADETLGAVGRVVAAEAALLRSLLDAGFTPVVASIAAREGKLLNVNADEVAAALAVALGADSLTLLSDVPGLELAGQPVPALDPAKMPAALAHPDVTGGMRPKLEAAARALDGGVARVTIGAWRGAGTLEDFAARRGRGTTITAATTTKTTTSANSDLEEDTAWLR